jgi:hypothetical protein
VDTVAARVRLPLLSFRFRHAGSSDLSVHISMARTRVAPDSDRPLPSHVASVSHLLRTWECVCFVRNMCVLVSRPTNFVVSIARPYDT